MAWFTYKCPDHGEYKISLQKREKTHLCPLCQKESKAIIKAGSISVVERLDNGAMARTVERLYNIEEIMSDRADKHSIPDEE